VSVSPARVLTNPASGGVHHKGHGAPARDHLSHYSTTFGNQSCELSAAVHVTQS